MSAVGLSFRKYRGLNLFGRVRRSHRFWPAAGAPPFFASGEEYDRAAATLVDTEVLLDQKMIYWDVRPSTNFSTVEVRGTDVPATVAEAVLPATLVRAAAITVLEAPVQGDDIGPPPGALRAAYCKAAHDGLSGQTIDLSYGRRSVPTLEQLSTLVRRVRPALDTLGEYDRVVDELDRIGTQGNNGATRQMQALRKRRGVTDVIAEAATATLS